jgi:hypothetical protein
MAQLAVRILSIERKATMTKTMTRVLTLRVVNMALGAIVAQAERAAKVEEDPLSPIGYPSYNEPGGGICDIENISADMIPRQIIWSADRGNWMWDGVLQLLRAMGVDPAAPLGEESNDTAIVVARTTGPDCVHRFVATCGSAAGMGASRREAVADLMAAGTFD